MQISGKWHRLGIRALSLFARILYIMFGGMHVYGLENIPRSGAVLLASNHTSLADPVGILAISPRLLHYMAAAELHEIPGIGPLIRFLQAFPVRRGENDVKAIAHCRQLLKAGEGVVIYPEGHLTPDGYLEEFSDGAVLIALRAKCPVVPVVMIGFDKMLPIGAKFLRFAYKEVHIGTPLYFDFSGSGLSIKEQAAQATLQLRRAMVELGARERPQPLPETTVERNAAK